MPQSMVWTWQLIFSGSAAFLLTIKLFMGYNISPLASNFSRYFIATVGMAIFLSAAIVLISFYKKHMSPELRFSLEIQGTIIFGSTWLGLIVLMITTLPGDIFVMVVFLGQVFGAFHRVHHMHNLQKAVEEEIASEDV